MKHYIFLSLAALMLLFAACSEEHTYYDTAAKADISANPQCEVGVPVTFTNSSVPTTGTSIVSYLWEFGDEAKSTSTEENPTFTFVRDGVFIVKLTVTDTHNLKATSQYKVTVVNPTKADFVTDASEYDMGEAVKFTNTSTTKGSTTITAYLWEFADAANSTSTEENPTFTYTEAGSYPVKLTVTDSYGLQTSITRSVNVLDPSKVIATQWTAAIGGAVKGGSSPALSPDGATVYVLRSLANSDVAALMAFNTSDGQMKWALDLSAAMSSQSATATAKDVFSSPSVSSDGTIHIVVRDLQSTTANRGVYALAINASGSVKWIKNVGDKSTNLYAITPAIDAAGNTYVATRAKKIWKISATGETTMFSDGLNDITGGLTISKAGIVYAFGKGNTGLQALNTQTGAVAWSYADNLGSAADAFTGALRSNQATIGRDGTAYFVTDTPEGGAIVAIGTNGTVKWTYKTVGAIPDGGVVIAPDGTLYANGGTDANTGLIALNADGSLKWTFATKAAVQTSPLIDNRGYVHVIDARGNYYIVKADGTLYSSAELDAANYSCPMMDSTGRLYVTVEKNGVPTLLCITSKASGYNADSAWPMRGQNPMRTGLQK